MHNAVLQERLLDCLQYEERNRKIASIVLEEDLRRADSKVLNLAIAGLCDRIELLQESLRFEQAKNEFKGEKYE